MGGEGFSDVHQPLMDEDLEEVTKSGSEEEEEEGQLAEEEEKEDVGLTLEHLATVARAAKDLQRMTEELDPNKVHSLQFANALEGVVSPYTMLLAQKKKQRQQLPITMFTTQTKRYVTTRSAAEEEASQAQDQHHQKKSLRKRCLWRSRKMLFSL